MTGTSGSFSAGSVKNLTRLNHRCNDFARNIASLFLPHRSEILVGEKRKQVEADNHVRIICK